MIQKPNEPFSVQDGRMWPVHAFILCTFQTPREPGWEERHAELKEANTSVNLAGLKCIVSVNSEETVDKNL